MQVWKKGVDSEAFHPRFRSDKMRARLTGNKPDQPVMIYAGRLSLEKNLFFLKNILERIPNLCLAFVGDGPTRAELEHAFRGTNTVFMGMMHVSNQHLGACISILSWLLDDICCVSCHVAHILDVAMQIHAALRSLPKVGLSITAVDSNVIVPAG